MHVLDAVSERGLALEEVTDLKQIVDDMCRLMLIFVIVQSTVREAVL